MHKTHMRSYTHYMIAFYILNIESYDYIHCTTLTILALVTIIISSFIIYAGIFDCNCGHPIQIW